MPTAYNYGYVTRCMQCTRESTHLLSVAYIADWIMIFKVGYNPRIDPHARLKIQMS
jgi:hypothetical protein